MSRIHSLPCVCELIPGAFYQIHMSLQRSWKGKVGSSSFRLNIGHSLLPAPSLMGGLPRGRACCPHLPMSLCFPPAEPTSAQLRVSRHGVPISQAGKLRPRAVGGCGHLAGAGSRAAPRLTAFSAGLAVPNSTAREQQHLVCNYPSASLKQALWFVAFCAVSE